MTLLAVLALLYGTHADPVHTDALTRAAALHRADLALVSAIAMQESSVGTRGTILTGAHLRLPRSACPGLPRRRLCLNRDPDAQANYAARLFGRVPRRHWPRMLAGWRCGPNAACQRTTGAAYARRVLTLRDDIHRALRRSR